VPQPGLDHLRVEIRGDQRRGVARARALREAAGVSLGQMAAECGTTKSTISVWERRPGIEIGRQAAHRATARKWLAILHLLDTAGPG
jgi:DNA-binding transcriptional regulator YiaG